MVLPNTINIFRSMEIVFRPFECNVFPINSRLRIIAAKLAKMLQEQSTAYTYRMFMPSADAGNAVESLRFRFAPKISTAFDPTRTPLCE